MHGGSKKELQEKRERYDKFNVTFTVAVMFFNFITGTILSLADYKIFSKKLSLIRRYSHANLVILDTLSTIMMLCALYNYK